MLPVFMQDEKVGQCLREAMRAVPKGTKAYVVGGAARNAVYHHQCGKQLPQRDYDLVIIGDLAQYVENLRAAGFTYGRIRRKDHVTLKKKLVQKPKDRFRDYLVLDVQRALERNIRRSLQNNTQFTINGFALSLRALTSELWPTKIIALPGAEADLRNKQLRVLDAVHPAGLFAAIRFMHLGFHRPSKKDVRILVERFASFEKWRFPRNVRKVYDYVDGRKNALALAKRLGLGDIFSYRYVERLRATVRP